MENEKKLRKKIRKFIEEEMSMGSSSPNFFMHGDGGGKFPYEEEVYEKEREEEQKLQQQTNRLGMEPISGAGLHQTGANM